RRDWKDRAREGQDGRGNRDRRPPRRHPEDGRDGRRDVQQDPRRGDGGRQRGLPPERHRKERPRARPGPRAPRQHYPTPQVRRGGVGPDEGGGRPPHTVLHGLPAPVLLPHHGRHRHGGPEGRRDVHAGRQHHHDDRADHPHRDGGRPPVRDP